MQTTRLDLGPQADVLRRVVAGVRDDQLTAPTPCPDTTVAALLDHVVGLTYAFRRTAEKRPGPAATADASNLTPDWRSVIPGQLDAMVAAWRRPEAWKGAAEAAGVELPAPTMAAVALDEVLVHGWDLAVATGQEFTADPASVEGAMGFVAQVAAGPPQEGLFGPPVPVPDDAPPLHRLLGLTGRDPSWRPLS